MIRTIIADCRLLRIPAATRHSNGVLTDTFSDTGTHRLFWTHCELTKMIVGHGCLTLQVPSSLGRISLGTFTGYWDQFWQPWGFTSVW